MSVALVQNAISKKMTEIGGSPRCQEMVAEVRSRTTELPKDGNSVYINHNTVVYRIGENQYKVYSRAKEQDAFTLQDEKTYNADTLNSEFSEMKYALEPQAAAAAAGPSSGDAVSVSAYVDDIVASFKQAVDPQFIGTIAAVDVGLTQETIAEILPVLDLGAGLRAQEAK